MKIRMRRTGTTNTAAFRIVVADTRSPRDGRFIEVLGHYNPRAKDAAAKVAINGERLLYWCSKGATISDAVRPVLKAAKVALPPARARKSTKNAGAAAPASA
jgi:small subunit ribosomal protein S16